MASPTRSQLAQSRCGIAIWSQRGRLRPVPSYSPTHMWQCCVLPAVACRLSEDDAPALFDLFVRHRARRRTEPVLVALVPACGVEVRCGATLVAQHTAAHGLLNLVIPVEVSRLALMDTRPGKIALRRHVAGDQVLAFDVIPAVSIWVVSTVNLAP